MRPFPARIVASLAGVALFLTACATVVTADRAAHAQQAPAPPVVPWSQIKGNPMPIRRNLPPGFYIYRDGKELVVVSHGVKARGLVFLGRVAVEGGTIVKPRAFVLERPQGDRFVQQTPNVLDFQVLTYAKVDGVRFAVKGGQKIWLDVRLQGQPTERVFFGDRPTQVVGNPIVIDMTQ